MRFSLKQNQSQANTEHHKPKQQFCEIICFGEKKKEHVFSLNKLSRNNLERMKEVRKLFNTLEPLWQDQ